MKAKIGQQFDCLRCGKQWHARKTEVRMCPSCKTPYFNVPRKAKAVA